MQIEFFPEPRIFVLHGPRFSYALQALPGGEIAHLYWGPRLRSGAGTLEEMAGSAVPEPRAFAAEQDPERPSFSLDTLPQEYPTSGGTDRRLPALAVRRKADGSRMADLRYASHEICAGKPALQGLPATYAEGDAEAMTLRLTLRDAVTGLQVELLYTVFRDHDALARSARVVNGGREVLEIEGVHSASVDLPEAVGAGGWQFLQLSGAWARERHVVLRPVTPGVNSIESRSGASSHGQNPFIGLLAPGANEESGWVYGFSLVYSGNFFAGVEVGPNGTARALIGINPFDFGWRLEPGEVLQAPEAVLVFSAEGLGDMSRTYHRLYRNRLCRGHWRTRERPVLINNWEATYFNFDAAKIERLASTAASLGVELLVLDDGWFGQRDDDRKGLGDWDVINANKLPAGLGNLASRVHAAGLKFGLWFEPEMVSPDSDLYRAHPDWCLHVPGRQRSRTRHQLTLDFSRKEVREAIYEKVAGVLRSAPITYVKWDMNRNFSETGSAGLPPERQREVPHRYMLGLYEVLERLCGEFPEILFESCSGGGGRFDPGMLYYMPQTWTSDDTDAIERLKIQHGTSIVYPPSSMGAHVSASPNHQVGRMTPADTRGYVAFIGAFGYEMDLDKLSEEERGFIREQVSLYKSLRPLLQGGDLYRLLSPFEPDANETAWMVVDTARSDAFVACVRTLARPNNPSMRLRLRGLDPARDYRVTTLPRRNAHPPAREFSCGGDFLLSAGLPVPNVWGDFSSFSWRLQAL